MHETICKTPTIFNGLDKYLVLLWTMFIRVKHSPWKRQCANAFDNVQNAKQTIIIHLNNGAKLKTLGKILKQSRIWKTLLYNVLIHLFCICLMMANPSTLLYCTVLYENTCYFTLFWSKDRTVQESTVQYSRVQYSTELYCIVYWRGF